MPRTVSFVAASAATALLLSACAAGPGAGPGGTQLVTAPSSCAELQAQIAHAQDERRTALHKQEGAWKAVVPFAVAARYASGQAAAGTADKRMATLQAASERQGCAQDAGTSRQH